MLSLRVQFLDARRFAPISAQPSCLDASRNPHRIPEVEDARMLLRFMSAFGLFLLPVLNRSLIILHPSTPYVSPPDATIHVSKVPIDVATNARAYFMQFQTVHRRWQSLLEYGNSSLWQSGRHLQQPIIRQ